MKTPMQEMFDQLKASKKDEYGLAFAIDMLLENEESMLEKEKEVMCEFADSCFDEINDQGYRNVIEVIDEHYNETFNTKEK